MDFLVKFWLIFLGFQRVGGGGEKPFQGFSGGELPVTQLVSKPVTAIPNVYWLVGFISGDGCHPPEGRG